MELYEILYIYIINLYKFILGNNYHVLTFILSLPIQVQLEEGILTKYGSIVVAQSRSPSPFTTL